MANLLFSTYSQGENRVTASILAVLERVSFALTERLLQALCQEPETPLLTFTNQPRGVASIPDARIRASFAYWIETKVQKNAAREDQIRAHLRALDQDGDVGRHRLLVLTPDERMPAAIERVSDRRVAWASFDDLVRAIQDIAAEPQGDWFVSDRPSVTEQERELLRELVRFLIAENLVGVNRKRVAVVAARIALDEYVKYSAYICQPGRIFQPSAHMGFYANKSIDRHIPAIQATVEHILLSPEAVDAMQSLESPIQTRLRHLVEALERDKSDRLGEEHKVILLSAPNALETFVLPHDIVNDLVSESGRSIPFTQGQRYIWLDQLASNPRTTSALVTGTA